MIVGISCLSTWFHNSIASIKLLDYSEVVKCYTAISLGSCVDGNLMAGSDTFLFFRAHSSVT